MTRRVRRSGLMMPVNTERFVKSSWLRHSDSLDYDLEDSVPQAEKDNARVALQEAIKIGQKGGAEVSVRINCAYPEADLDAAVRPGVSRISHPKTEHADQIRKVDAIITRLERERGIRPGTIEINAMIETTLGVANSYEIASSSPRVRNFSPGTGYDMSMDMGLEMFVGFDQFFYNRGEGELIAMALGQNRAGGVYMSDTSGSVTDGDRTLQQAVANRKAGFRSGGGLHPNVVQPQNIGLTPTPDEVDRARRVLALFDQSDARGEVEAELNGETVDAYEASRARELIDWAAACARRDAEKAAKRAASLAVEEAAGG